MMNRFFATLLFAMAATLSVSAQSDSMRQTSISDEFLPKAIHEDSVPRKRMRVNGYRVQVYYGGNNHKSKLQAQRMAERAKIWFEEHSVYTSFISPHWICRVGDFQTREEATVMLKEMRESGRFPMAVIVKSKVNVFVDEHSRTESADSCATGDKTACKENIGTSW